MTAKQRSVDEYERLGLNPYHHAILALLEGSAPETQAEIADALGYDRGTLVGLLDGSRSRSSSSASVTPTTVAGSWSESPPTASERSGSSAR